MPKQLDPMLVEILSKYGEEAERALWDCHGTWVVYHKAIERIAAKAGVVFDMPQIIEAASRDKTVAIAVRGTMGDRSEWSFGEAAPHNNKNAYPYAMAEKRAKDRVVLKLVGLHGLAYSEEESDDFKPKAPASDATAAPTNEPPRKANGKPEKGWREDGTQTSYALKNDKAWEKLKADLDNEMLDVRDEKGLSIVREHFRERARSEKWNPTYMFALSDVFEGYAESIRNGTHPFPGDLPSNGHGGRHISTIEAG